MEKLTLIIPAKNESESLPKVLQSLKKINCKIIVSLKDNDRSITIEPSISSFEVDFTLTYKNSIISTQSNTINFIRIKHMKDYGILLAKEIRDSQKKYTELGSLTYLLFGRQASKQSINIKLGHLGEKLFKRLIFENKSLEDLIKNNKETRV